MRSGHAGRSSIIGRPDRIAQERDFGQKLLNKQAPTKREARSAHEGSGGHFNQAARRTCQVERHLAARDTER